MRNLKPTVHKLSRPEMSKRRRKADYVLVSFFSQQRRYAKGRLLRSLLKWNEEGTFVSFKKFKHNISRHSDVSTSLAKKLYSDLEMDRAEDKVLSGKVHVGIGNLFEEAAKLQQLIDAKKNDHLQQS